jgi:nitrite reductase (NADH) small subunit
MTGAGGNVAVRRWVRWAVVGRRNGIRASVRRTVGCFTWLDAPPVAHKPSEPVVVERTDTWSSPATPISPGWTRLAHVDELPVGTVTEVAAGDRTVALANVDGQLYAVDSTCPHAGGPLGDGQLSGCTLTCPWHGWSYDVRTGRSTVDENVKVATFPVEVVDGVAYLTV